MTPPYVELDINHPAVSLWMFPVLSLYHHPCIKVFPYEILCVWVIYEVVPQGHKFVLWYIVEELLQVDINYVGISIIEILKQFDNCLLNSAIRSESIAILTEVWFCYWGQYLWL